MAGALVKICGLRTLADVEAANRAKPDFVGFVFAPGRRRTVGFEEAARLKEALDEGIRAVGVFVDPDPAFVARLVAEKVIDLVQLHGSEGEAQIAAVREACGRAVRERDGACEEDGACGRGVPGERVPVIKAFRVRTADDVAAARGSSADYVLFDHGAGGTGERFDWGALEGLDIPFFLAGGLEPGSVGDALKTGAYALDVSSGVETDGVKDVAKMMAFVANVRKG